MSWINRMLVVVLLLGSVGSRPAVAHDFSLTEAVLTVRGDGRIVLDLICDLDALSLGLPSGSGSQGHDGQILAQRISNLPVAERSVLEERLRRMFERRVRLRFDGSPVRHQVAFPETDSAAAPPGENLREASLQPGSEDGEVDSSRPPAPRESFFGVTARLFVTTPTDTQWMTVAPSRAFGPVHLTVLQQRGHDVSRMLLGIGTESEEIPLLLTTDEGRTGLDPVEEAEAASAVSPSSSGNWQALREYFSLGFIHILPRGSDHVAFVFALCLATLRWRWLAVWVSSFTVGHTLSLALASKRLVIVSPALVEPLIALSIGLVALRTLLRRRAKQPGGEDQSGWENSPDSGAVAGKLRTPMVEGWIVLLLGLLHGFGFAGILGTLGLPEQSWWFGLVGFNLGVEAGQLVVLVAGVFLIRLLIKALPKVPWIAVFSLGLIIYSSVLFLQRL